MVRKASTFTAFSFHVSHAPTAQVTTYSASCGLWNSKVASSFGPPSTATISPYNAAPKTKTPLMPKNSARASADAFVSCQPRHRMKGTRVTTMKYALCLAASARPKARPV